MRIRSRDLEEVWTPEQIAEWERIIRRRKRLALTVLALFVVLAVLLYLFLLSEPMGWPRPSGLIHLGALILEQEDIGTEAVHGALVSAGNG